MDPAPINQFIEPINQLHEKILKLSQKFSERNSP